MIAFLKGHVTKWFQFMNGKWKVRRGLPATCPWIILSWSENLFCRMVFLPYSLMLPFLALSYLEFHVFHWSPYFGVYYCFPILLVVCRYIGETSANFLKIGTSKIPLQRFFVGLQSPGLLTGPKGFVPISQSPIFDVGKVTSEGWAPTPSQNSSILVIISLREDTFSACRFCIFWILVYIWLTRCQEAILMSIKGLGGSFMFFRWWCNLCIFNAVIVLVHDICIWNGGDIYFDAFYIPWILLLSQFTKTNH